MTQGTGLPRDPIGRSYFALSSRPTKWLNCANTSRRESLSIISIQTPVHAGGHNGGLAYLFAVKQQTAAFHHDSEFILNDFQCGSLFRVIGTANRPLPLKRSVCPGT